MNENNKIDILLNGKEYLKNEYVYKRNSIFVKSVLEMKEWDNPKFSGLLTSTIWNSNIENIKNILQICELKEEKYSHLLRPTIFAVNVKNIISTIMLYKEYGIDEYITNNCLRKNIKIHRDLIEYLIKENIDLVVEK